MLTSGGLIPVIKLDFPLSLLKKHPVVSTTNGQSCTGPEGHLTTKTHLLLGVTGRGIRREGSAWALSPTPAIRANLAPQAPAVLTR